MQRVWSESGKSVGHDEAARTTNNDNKNDDDSEAEGMVTESQMSERAIAFSIDSLLSRSIRTATSCGKNYSLTVRTCGAEIK